MKMREKQGERLQCSCAEDALAGSMRRRQLLARALSQINRKHAQARERLDGAFALAAASAAFLSSLPAPRPASAPSTPMLAATAEKQDFEFLPRKVSKRKFYALLWAAVSAKFRNAWYHEQARPNRGIRVEKQTLR